MSTNNRILFRIATLAAPAVCVAQLAQADEYKITDDVTATTNVTVSVGASFRTSDPDSEVVFSGNGARNGVDGTAASATQDDGTLNFDKGDVVTAPISVIADVDFNFQRDYGVFVRGKAVYDMALEHHEANHGHSANGYEAGGKLNDDNFDNLAQFSSVALLDAFAYGEFEVADNPLQLRAGRQVISWGEGLLIQGGINTINPIDVTAFRRPGVQLKEGLLPLGSIYGNLGVTDDLSVEAFWNFEWGNTVLDGCGTYFSTNDVAAQGCDELSLATVGAAVNPALFGDDQLSSDALANTGGAVPGFYLERAGDKDPDIINPDQFGVAARYFAEPLDTEFGVYFTYLDSRTPNLSYETGTITPGGPLLGEAPGAARYRTEYAEDIITIGVSAATEVAGVAIAGELSYRPNQPVQINTNDLTAASATAGNSIALGVVDNPADALFAGTAAGTDVEGYVDAQQIKGQISAVMFFDRSLGADRVTVLGEIGFEHLDIDNPLGLNLGRGSIYGNPNSSGNNAEGLITNFSAGYRARVSATYSDVFLGVNVTPSLAFAHDIDGYSSDGQFSDDRTQLGVGLGFDYLNTYTLNFNYSNTMTGDFVDNKDRDFFGVNFVTQF